MSPDDQDWTYNGLDCCVTLEILEELLPQVDDVAAKTYDFSRALQGPVMEMSLRGMKVDEEARKTALAGFEAKIEKISANLDRIIGEGIGVPNLNWKSPTQLKSLFYDVMGLTPIRKRNAKGQMAPTVNREALEKLSLNFFAEPLCLHLLALRDTEKKAQLLRTGIDPDGRFRTSFNIAGTTTGRLASSESVFGTGSNMQNIDRDLRRVFVADPGMAFVNLDLEQADARNVGAICWELFVDSHGEEFAGAYLNACESGDLHTRVCRMAWKTLPWGDDPAGWRKVADQIAYRTDSYRDLSKKLGHGTNFRGTPPTMAKHTKVEKSIIADFQSNYFRAFGCIPAWHQWLNDQIKNYSYIITPFGRRRYFFGRYNDDKTLRDATAYAPQSMTADEIDLGILEIWRAHRVQVLLQVHDSILIQCPEEMVEEVTEWALKTLRQTLHLKRGREFTVPTEAKVGYNYGDYLTPEDAAKKKTDPNPDGLMKWRGSHTRKRTVRPRSAALSVARFL